MAQASIKKEKPLVSVILPCYNAMPFLEVSVDSILNQTYKNLEILCIDDGSLDETHAYLIEKEREDQRIKVIKNETNIGLIRTLNESIPQAKGQFIARIDADDFASPDLIEICVNELLQRPELDLVCPNSSNIDEEGNLLNFNFVRTYSSKANFFASFFFVPISHGGLVCKTELLRNNPYLNEEIALHTEDFELFARLLSLGFNLRNITDILYHIRINSKSVSRMHTTIQDENFMRCATDHYVSYTGKSLGLREQQVVFNRIPTTFKLRDIKLGLRIVNQLKSTFIEKEKIIDETILKELKVVQLTHKLDILVQAFKRGKVPQKFLLFPSLAYNLFLNIINRSAWNYLRSKRSR